MKDIQLAQNNAQFKAAVNCNPKIDGNILTSILGHFL